MARRHEHTKEEIQSLAIAAGLQLVEQHGPTGITARKVASEMGYTVGTLYVVFKNIDDLILHINAISLETLRHELSTQPAQIEENMLHSYAQQYLTLVMRDPMRWRLVYEHTMNQGKEVPSWYQDLTSKVFSLIASQLVNIGPKRNPKEVTLGAQTLWSSVHGICQLQASNKLQMGGNNPAQDVITTLMTHFINSWKYAL